MGYEDYKVICIHLYKAFVSQVLIRTKPKSWSPVMNKLVPVMFITYEKVQSSPHFLSNMKEIWSEVCSLTMLVLLKVVWDIILILPGISAMSSSSSRIRQVHNQIINNNLTPVMVYIREQSGSQQKFIDLILIAL